MGEILAPHSFLPYLASILVGPLLSKWVVGVYRQSTLLNARISSVL